MKSKHKGPALPSPWPWENFEPAVVTLSALREDPRYFLRLEAAREERLVDAQVTLANVAAIATALGLEKGRQDRLALDFALIASWCLGPQVQERLKMDVIACRRQLSRAAKAARELGDALAQIDTTIGASFRELYNHATADPAALGEPVAFDSMAREVLKIGRTAETLELALKPSRVGRRGVFFRDAAVSLICEALKEAGAEPVAISHGKGDRAGTHLHFTNGSGRALARLFKLCDRRTDESLLVRSFESVRRKCRSSNLAKNTLGGG